MQSEFGIFLIIWLRIIAGRVLFKSHTCFFFFILKKNAMERVGEGWGKYCGRV